MVYVGSFYDPFPNLEAGAAPEHPDRVAEVLLNRYIEQGPSFLDGLVGHYSLVVLDSRSRTVHLAADPYGQRSPFYFCDGDCLAFGSNLAATVGMLDNPSIDRSWEDFLLVYGFYPDGCTTFFGVQMVPTGSLLSWSGCELSLRTIAPYRSETPAHPVSPDDLPSTIDALYDVFLNTLRQQCGTAEHVAVLLGGFDSALVAAGLKHLGKKVSTWSFAYEEEKYNQPNVQAVSRHLETTHQWVPVTPSDIRQGLEDFPLVFNQPTNWPNYAIQTAMLCKRIKQAGISSAYSGDGCDTVFLGYPGTWKRARVFQHFPAMPKWLADSIAALAARPTLERRLGHPYRVFLGLIRSSSWSEHARNLLSFRLLDEISLRQLRGSQTPTNGQDLREATERLASPFRHLPPLRLAYQGKALVSPNRNKMNGSSDQTGIPIHSPYLHPAFKQFAQSLPEELCRPRQATNSRVTGKYILMQMAEKYHLLPPEVIYQKKVAAVDAPIDSWYAGTMRDFMKAQMANLPFSADMRYVDALLKPHIAESLYQKILLNDRVIKQAPSLLATYAGFCALAQHSTNSKGTKK